MSATTNTPWTKMDGLYCGAELETRLCLSDSSGRVEFRLLGFADSWFTSASDVHAGTKHVLTGNSNFLKWLQYALYAQKHAANIATRCGCEHTRLTTCDVLFGDRIKLIENAIADHARKLEMLRGWGVS